MAMGMAMAAEGNDQAAIDEFKDADRLQADFTGLHAEMGASYLKLKMYDEAIAAFLKQKASGDDASVENGLAEAYTAKGMTQQAQEARSKAEQMKEH
jgi:tetratricopeptide (TPR) repeat protein